MTWPGKKNDSGKSFLLEEDELGDMLSRSLSSLKIWDDSD